MNTKPNHFYKLTKPRKYDKNNFLYAETLVKEGAYTIRLFPAKSTLSFPKELSFYHKIGFFNPYIFKQHDVVHLGNFKLYFYLDQIV